jgi:hypothetical protein
MVGFAFPIPAMTRDVGDYGDSTAFPVYPRLSALIRGKDSGCSPCLSASVVGFVFQNHRFFLKYTSVATVVSAIKPIEYMVP